MHPRVAGSGSHLPSASHTALILPAGTNPGLQLKNISAPSSVFWNGSMEPLSGVMGLPQLTGRIIIWWWGGEGRGGGKGQQRRQVQSCDHHIKGSPRPHCNKLTSVIINTQLRCQRWQEARKSCNYMDNVFWKPPKLSIWKQLANAGNKVFKLRFQFVNLDKTHCLLNLLVSGEITKVSQTQNTLVCFDIPSNNVHLQKSQSRMVMLHWYSKPNTQ